MRHSGWQQPAGGQRFDPLAAGGDIPSWPDQAGSGPPRLSFSGDDAVASAWPELPGLPEVGPAEERLAVGARVLLPLAAALVVIAAFLFLPWTVAGEAYPAAVASLSGERADAFGARYVAYLAGPVALIATLAGFAAATGFGWLRWTQLGVAAAAFAVVWLLAAGEPAGFRPTLIVFTAVGLVWAAVIGFARRLALRVSAGSFLLACALLHLGAVAAWDVAGLTAWAYLPAAGYLVGAGGALIGPRHVSVRRPF